MQTEQTQTAIIIPFPKRARAISAHATAPRPTAPRPNLPITTAPKVAPVAVVSKMPAFQPQPVIRPLQAAPAISRPAGLTAQTAGMPTGTPMGTPVGTRTGTKKNDLADSGAAQPLSGVMAELDHALTQQGAAVARWRNAINDLRTAMDGLEGTLKQYRDSLQPSMKGVAR